MSDAMSPSQFQILREDIAQMRSEFNGRFDSLVTRDAFRDERARVDERLSSLGREIGENKAAIDAEALARTTEQQATLRAQQHDKAEREKERRARSWQWFALFASPVVSGIIAYVVGTASNGGAP